ncbi:cupredoxin domain-containing protein [Halorussus salinus]|uniref:cupredoxin domain-containing protein n=1 Tax=Halorussus salinus TaxID=1364935 RepID=UPI001EE4B47A|nr:plastocyanin/azurin family copper-binding protein [Halorussus salinus]
MVFGARASVADEARRREVRGLSDCEPWVLELRPVDSWGLAASLPEEMTGDSSPAPRGDSAEAGGESEPDESGGDGVTRRAFVRTSGAAAGMGASALLADDAAAQTQTYRFGGEVAAWQGRAPAAIEGQSNPTVELEAGREYEFWFENLDGQPHNIVIQDADGNAIVESELVSEEGATASVTFTATPAMTTYICTVHPTTMVGDLTVTGQAEGGGESGGLFGTLPFGALVVLGVIALALVSPVLFALFLFSRGGSGGDETTTRT